MELKESEANAPSMGECNPLLVPDTAINGV